ncbi:hypothetical protein EES42_25045 [Streptomyces sp. ADI95-17]|nr:hypothetical protein EES42_25045 [Streptomyces sp. ADI95-17]
MILRMSGFCLSDSGSRKRRWLVTTPSSRGMSGFAQEMAGVVGDAGPGQVHRYG